MKKQAKKTGKTEKDKKGEELDLIFKELLEQKKKSIEGSELEEESSDFSVDPMELPFLF